MNRRSFLRGLVGAGAVAAVAPVLPSEVWPFRKIFAAPARWLGIDFGFDDPQALTWYANSDQTGALIKLQEELNSITALQLEQFEKSIPDLLYRDDTIYKMFRGGRNGAYASQLGALDSPLPGVPMPAPGTYLGLSRSKYPGRLPVNLRIPFVNGSVGKRVDLLDMSGWGGRAPKLLAEEDRQIRELNREVNDALSDIAKAGKIRIPSAS